jgi:hypothetical protein
VRHTLLLVHGHWLLELRLLGGMLLLLLLWRWLQLLLLWRQLQLLLQAAGVG